MKKYLIFSIITVILIAQGIITWATIFKTAELLKSQESTTIYVYGKIAEQSLGKLKITAYTDNIQCTGKNKGNISSGTRPRSHITASCDREYKGKFIFVEGIGTRLCEDTGSAVNKEVIDLYFPSYEAAKAFGSQRRQVWLLK